MEEDINKTLKTILDRQDKLETEIKTKIQNLEDALKSLLEAQKQPLNKFVQEQEQKIRYTHDIDSILACPDCKTKLSNFIKNVIQEEKKKEEPEIITKRIGGIIFKYKKEK